MLFFHVFNPVQSGKKNRKRIKNILKIDEKRKEQTINDRNCGE